MRAAVLEGMQRYIARTFGIDPAAFSKKRRNIVERAATMVYLVFLEDILGMPAREAQVRTSSGYRLAALAKQLPRESIAEWLETVVANAETNPTTELQIIKSAIEIAKGGAHAVVDGED